MKARIIGTASVLTLIAALSFGILGCTPGESSENESSELSSDSATVSGEMVEVDGEMISIEEAIEQAEATDPYVADEVCLSCHGGTYQAVEQLTIDLKDSNPHGGTHGNGGMSCNGCHVSGQMKPTDDQNICLDCHIWPRDEQSYIEDMDL